MPHIENKMFNRILKKMESIPNDRLEITVTWWDIDGQKKIVFSGLRDHAIQSLKTNLEKGFEQPFNYHSVLIKDKTNKENTILLYSPVSSEDFKEVQKQILKEAKKDSYKEYVFCKKYVGLLKNDLSIYDLYKIEC